MDHEWRIHRALCLPCILPWRNHLRELEAYLEDMATAEGKVLPMAGKP
jgi:hypothetical protein